MKHTFLFLLACLASLGITAQDEVNTRRLGANVPATTGGVSVLATPWTTNAPKSRRVVLDDDFTTEGTSFWVTFMQNYEYRASSRELQMQLVFSSRTAASIKVSNPNTGWSTTSSVSANGVTIITVPTVQCYNAQADMLFDYYGNTTGLRAFTTDGPQNTGLYIESTAPISVYGSNYASCTFDATNVLPTASLGTDYVIQAYRTQKEGNTEFAIVATEDNTNVTIALSAPTLFKSKSTYSVHLNKGQVYMCVAAAAKGTLGGTVIQADKKIAVFNGDIDSYVPDNYGYCDHMCEQAMPVQTWGKQFVVTKTYGQVADYVMLTAIKDGTQIKKNGTVVATINTCQHYLYRLTESAAYFETSEPCACYIYQTSRTNNRTQLGDPSMVWITPLEQGIKQITFATFKTKVSQYHYVNIVVPTSAVGSMMMDGTKLTGFTTVPGNAEYSYLCKKINHGTHTLQNSNAEFVAHVYGMGVDESYAYCVGGYLRKINETDIEEIIEHETVTQTYDICEGQSVTIAGKEYSENAVVLDTIGNVIKKYTVVVHQSFLSEETIEFQEGSSFYWRGKKISVPGTYKDEKVSKWGCDSVYRLIAKYDNVILTYDTICADAFYKFRGQSFSLPTGPFPMDYTVKKTEGDWEYHMQLRILPNVTYHTDSYVLDPNEVYAYHGINISSAGQYTVNLTNQHGCDSVVTLTVTQPVSTRSYYAICEGESYTFGGTAYTQSGTYQYKTTTSDGSQKVHELILTVYPSAETVINATICEGESYMSKGFLESKKGTYYRYLKTANGCDSTVILNLSVCAPKSDTIYDTFCKGTIYDKNGFNVTRAGTHVRALHNIYGCDSTITLILTEKPSYHFSENIVLIDDETKVWHGQTLSAKGTYTASYSTKDGCDSIYTANVRKVVGVTEEVYDTLCTATTYDYRGQTFDIPASDVHPFDFVMEVRDLEECKRYRMILTLLGGTHYPATYELEPNVTVWHDTVEVSKKVASYTFGSQTITEAGIYSETFTSVSGGCDSIVDLTVTQPIITDDYIEKDICLGGSYIFVNGQSLTRPGIYVDSTYDDVRKGYDITTLKLNVSPRYSFEIDTIIQEGQTYVDDNFNKSTPGRYSVTYTTISGCDSIYTLRLKVCSPVSIPLEATIIDGDVYDKNGFLAYTEGTYVHHDISAAGCDSTTTLNLKVLPKIAPTYIDSTICQGTTITWEGSNYSSAGTYTKTFTLPDGRDSLRILRLSIVPVYADTIYAEICQGEAYTEYNFNETTTGTYTQTNTSIGGCDSTMTLVLVVHPTYSTDIYEKICNGDVYNKYGLSTNTAGDYVRRYTTDAGCDSILNIHISVAEPSDSIFKATIKPGQSVVFDGKTYTDTYYEKKVVDTPNAVGCDSTLTIDIFLDKYILTSIDTAFCEGDSIEIFGDTIVKTEGFYMRTYPTAHGSDSVVTWGVTILQHTDSLTKVTLHKGQTITWHGVTYDKPTIQYDTLVNAAGCDSICTLELDYSDIVVNRMNIKFCQGDSAWLWNNDSIVKTAGTYQRKYASYFPGVDSLAIYEVKVLMPTDSNTVVTINQGEAYTWHGEVYTEPTFKTDTLINAAGCDSICTLTLKVVGHVYRDSAYVCENELESFTWEGETFTKDNLVRTKTLPSAHGDSVVIFTVYLHPVKYNPTDKVIRQGETYTWHDKVYSRDTIVVDTLRSMYDCDSICTLSLIVTDAPVTYDSANVCENELESFTWQGKTFTKEQLTQTHTFSTGHGDSVVIFRVHLKPVEYSSTPVVIHQGQTYTWHDKVYDKDTTVIDTLESQYGCDSICTLSLTVTAAPIYYDSADVCENEIGSFVWEGNHFSKEQLSATHTYTTANGDSIVQFQVVLLPSYALPQEKEICREELPYTWEGLTFTAEGSQTKTLQTYLGCDSVVTYTVRVKECTQPCVPLKFTATIDSVCANDEAIVVNIHPSQGKIISSNVRFSAEARDHGFHDTIANVSADGTQIMVPLRRIGESKDYPRPDMYAMLLTVQDSCGNSYTDSVTYQVLYPSWIILQRWNDVLALYNDQYNGGYSFSNIRWFHNGELIEGRGEHNSYIYILPNLLFGDAYWAELTRTDDGKTIRTCSCYPTQANDQTVFKSSVRLLPRYKDNSRVWNVQTNMSGNYLVYDTTGKRIQHGHFGEQYDSPDIVLNEAPVGTYVVLFIGEDGVMASQKIIVEK